MPDLAAHFAYAEAAIGEARAAPLSLRKVRLAAALIDALVDRLYDADPSRAADIIAHRKAMADHPDLGLVMRLAEASTETPHVLHVETVALQSADYPRLTEAEYMVSLYNSATIPRLMLTAQNKSEDAHRVLASAFSALQRALLTRPRPSSASPPR